MRIQRSVQVLTILTMLAACAPMGRNGRTEDRASVSVQWDSGPLDRSYQHERTDMDARHVQEVAHPRADESSDQQGKRHASENQDLERRYAQGKAAHAQTLPASDR